MARLIRLSVYEDFNSFEEFQIKTEKNAEMEKNPATQMIKSNIYHDNMMSLFRNTDTASDHRIL